MDEATSTSPRKRGRPPGSTKARQTHSRAQRGGKKGRRWDSLDKSLLELYGYDLDKPGASKPQFGSAFRPVLTVEGETKQWEPTPYNIAIHLGYMDWMDPIIKRLTQVKLPADQFKRLVDMCRKGSRDLLEMHLTSLRKALLAEENPFPCYFYCVAEVTLETDTVTGKPLTTDGPRVLCLLPKTPQVAQTAGLSESEIALLAPQVMYLITSTLLSHHLIRTANQLSEAIDGWSAYLSPVVMGQIEETIRQADPLLLPPSQSLLALPPGA